MTKDETDESKYLKRVIDSYTSHIKLNQRKINELIDLNVKLDIGRSKIIEEYDEVNCDKR